MSHLYGIRQSKGVRVLRAGRQLLEPGNSSASSAEVVQKCNVFTTACHWHKAAATMSDVR